ncbi:hypothetical protein BKA65DRAFT_261054 [Rhexocercosporidium sp. MPI-PUGE-AT-0058]|nr:hypothetical protein BKA65DRAFT_261054 [Rhexocercosporidium sp. MPI-PUGE-AT-0058]
MGSRLPSAMWTKVVATKHLSVASPSSPSPASAVASPASPPSSPPKSIQGSELPVFLARSSTTVPGGKLFSLWVWSVASTVPLSISVRSPTNSPMSKAVSIATPTTTKIAPVALLLGSGRGNVSIARPAMTRVPANALILSLTALPLEGGAVLSAGAGRCCKGG